ncbi:MAG TPA: DUF1206 domain-containing protein [Gemmatimonadales bacterium]|nr:DUF1206 domain-containing protein [Gemmatimonadales bacterium]
MSPPAEVAPWVERLARVGYVAKAVLYGTIGILAAQAAFGEGGGTTDTRGALRALLAAPYGRGMLAVVAIGLLGYTAWLLVRAVTDAEHRGREPKGIAMRVGDVVRGLAHGALALAALRLARGEGDGGGGDGAREWAGRVMEAPLGEVLLWIAAVGIGGYGLYQVYRAFAAKLSRRLSLGELPPGTAGWIIAVSRFGIGARGVVFCFIAWFVARAAAEHDPAKAGGVRESLRALAEMGHWPLAAVGLGFVAYGVYELVNARYRRIQVA